MKLILLTLAMTLGALACDNPKRPSQPPATQEAVKSVTVSQAGTTFDPPVKISQIPAGAHYCDIGTVHYARMDKGDGKCAECGMMLKTKPGDAKGHEGHSH